MTGPAAPAAPGGPVARRVRRAVLAALGEERAYGERSAVVKDLVDHWGTPGRLWALVAELAEGSGDPAGCARRSYPHVLGFDKLLLLDGGPAFMLRAHLWHPGDAFARAREDIHNHRCALGSRVVRGTLGMALYEPCADGGMPAFHFREAPGPARSDWRFTPVGPARLRLVHTARYGTGSSYLLPPGTLHQAWNEEPGGTVTLYLEPGHDPTTPTDVYAACPERAAATGKPPFTVGEYLARLVGLEGLLRP